MGNKYIVGKTYNQSNKKGQGIDQFTEWLNIQENNVKSGVGNAQSIAPAYYINKNLDIFNFNEKKVPTYLVIVNSLSNNQYNNFVTNDNYIYHWGDSKSKNNHNSVDDFKGNRIFKLIYELMSTENVYIIPPILYFDKPQSGKLVFKGICILDELFLVNDFEDEGITIPNYLAKFKFTDDSEIEISMLHKRARAKSIEDLSENIPSGLKEEIKKLKDYDGDSCIKTLTLNEYLKIKGGVMGKQNELQENNLKEDDTLDIESIENKNISSWLLALDNLDNHFSRLETNREVSYQVSYSSNLNEDIKPQVNDFVIGYISDTASPKLLKYVFKITDILDSDESSKNQSIVSITFEKLFETSIDMDVNSISEIAPNIYNNITSISEINRLIAKIQHDEFNILIKFMLETLASNLFKTTLDIETRLTTKEKTRVDEFDISNKIDDLNELNDIKTYQSKIDDKTRNKIVYGAPGTGKSHKINDFKKQFFKNDFLFERVTFHPAYTYGQFVGTYKPSPIYSKDESDTKTSWYGADKEKNDDLMNPHIDYTLVAGPFLNMLCKALNNKDYNFLLVIEEMNRANAAAVFGDVFQLLDRDDDNTSTYSVKFNADITNFLIKNVKNNVSKDLFNRETGFVKIPKNLFIWGTMNSADEGVSKMDSAFKRRWSFEYTDIDPLEGSEKFDTINKRAIYIPFLNSGKGGYVPWNTFRKKLNDSLHDINKMLPEDKYIGPFFLNENELLDKDIIKSKLLLYLKDDVLKHSSDKLFNYFRFSDISKKFDSENIFKNDYIDAKYLESKIIENTDDYINLKDISKTEG